MRQRKTITLSLLDYHWVCGAAREQFIKDWGSKGKPTVYEVVKRCWRLGRGDWARWVMVFSIGNVLWREWEKARWECRRLSNFDGSRRNDYKYARLLGKETP